jgi:hypothetical protein
VAALKEALAKVLPAQQPLKASNKGDLATRPAGEEHEDIRRRR